MKSKINIESLLNSFDFFQNKDIVSYEFSIREMPAEWNFMIMMGIFDAINKTYLFEVGKDVLDEIYGDFGYKHNFTDKFLDFLSNFRFSGSIRSIPDGEIIFPGDPIVTITGTISEIELVKNSIIDILSENIGTMSHCTRCFIASNGIPLINTSRNSLTSKLSYIAGFEGTTNITANIKDKIPLRTNIDNISCIFNKENFKNRGVVILDYHDISSTIKDIKENCSIKLRDKNLDVNLEKAKKSGIEINSLLISCPDDIIKLFKTSMLSQIWSATIFTEVKPVYVQVESYPIYNHTQNKYLMIPTSGNSTLPGIKHVYIDQRDNSWKHLISIDALALVQEELDPLIETFMIDGKIVQEELETKAKRSVCNGSLISVPRELLDLSKSIKKPFIVHKSILDKYYQAYGELNE